MSLLKQYDQTQNGGGYLLRSSGGTLLRSSGGYFIRSSGSCLSGISTLGTNTSGSYNTANGLQALFYNTSGSSNTANGFNSLFTNTTGSNNTAIGNNADVLSGNLTNATAIGYNAHVSQSNSLVLGDTTNVNVGIGTGSPTKKLDVRGSIRIVDGTQGASKVLTSDANGNASWQTAGGGSSGWGLTGNSSTSASTNFIGTTDSVALTLKVNNAKAGLIDLYYYNTFYGLRAGNSNTGYYNVAIGYNALYSNTTGIDNAAFGYNALYSNTTGNYNTANGLQALYYNTTGFSNTANGISALFSNTTGYGNTANGYLALNYNSTGWYNTANGYNALQANSTGNNNTANGYYALGTNSTGSNNTALGYYADVSAGTYSNTTVIGNYATGTASNQVRVGNSSVTSIGGQVGWSTLSDGRMKENVKEEVPGLTFITSLRPVTYNLNTKKFDNFIMQQMPDSVKAKRMQTDDAYQTSSSVLHTGFIAQEVEAAAKKVGYIFDGVDAPKNDNDLYGIRYAEFVVPLVKAVQEQQLMIEQLKKENAEMKKQINSILNK